MPVVMKLYVASTHTRPPGRRRAGARSAATGTNLSLSLGSLGPRELASTEGSGAVRCIGAQEKGLRTAAASRGCHSKQEVVIRCEEHLLTKGGRRCVPPR